MLEPLRDLKVWQFFSALDLGERKALHEHLVGTAKSNSNDVLRTFAYFLKHASEIEAGHVTRGDLFRHLHGGLQFDMNHFNKPISRLITRIKEFWESAPLPFSSPLPLETHLQQKLRLMQKLETHCLDTEYEAEAKKLEALISGAYFFEDKYRLLANWKKIELTHHMRLHPHAQRPELEEMQKALEIQFAFDHLRIRAAIANQQKMAGDFVTLQHAEPEWNIVGQDALVFRFYRTFIALQAEPNAEIWAGLKGLFDQLVGNLSQDLLAEVSSLLISHASRTRNAGAASMQGELLDVYQQILDSGTLSRANWNIGSHLQNYLFLLGYEGDIGRAAEALAMVEGYEQEGKLQPSTALLLKAIFEEFFGDKRKAYKYYNDCLGAKCTLIEEVVARSKQLVLDYDNRHQNALPMDFGNTYAVFLSRKIWSQPVLQNHQNFVTCVRLLAAAEAEPAGSKARKRKLLKCREKIESLEGQPLLNKGWLMQQLAEL